MSLFVQQKGSSQVKQVEIHYLKRRNHPLCLLLCIIYIEKNILKIMSEKPVLPNLHQCQLLILKIIQFILKSTSLYICIGICVYIHRIIVTPCTCFFLWELFSLIKKLCNCYYYYFFWWIVEWRMKNYFFILLKGLHFPSRQYF